MALINFSDLISTLKKPEALQILFYLYEFNPNVSVEDLISKLNIKEDDVRRYLDTLEKSNVIVNSNKLYRLTIEGREMVRGFYYNIGKTPPEPKTGTSV